jgi:sigma-B regulation protein RsbU (phosphoserine phosphatase)
MSMFFLEVDPGRHTLRWVRAGHEPALVYHPQADDFSELSGDGMAMGIVADYTFKEYTTGELKSGNVVAITTDGIHETRNQKGEMFGLDRLREVIRSHAQNDAHSLQKSIIAAVEAFRGSAPQEDDITLVIIKVL